MVETTLLRIGLMHLVPLFVVESNELVIEGLRRVLARSRFRIAGHYTSIEELMEAAPTIEEVGAVIIDVEEPDSICAQVENLRRHFPAAKIVLMSDPGDCSQVMRTCENADGLILRSSGAAALVKALELITLGERIVPWAAWEGVESHSSSRPTTNGAANATTNGNEVSTRLDDFSEREMEVLNLLCEADANKVIARKLGISEATVKVHVKAILRKSRTKNRTQAALLMSALKRHGASANFVPARTWTNTAPVRT